MNYWILLLLLFCGNNGSNGCNMQNNCIEPRRTRDKRSGNDYRRDYGCECEKEDFCYRNDRDRERDGMWTPYSGKNDDCECEKERFDCNCND